MATIREQILFAGDNGYDVALFIDGCLRTQYLTINDWPQIMDVLTDDIRGDMKKLKVEVGRERYVTVLWKSGEWAVNHE